VRSTVPAPLPWQPRLAASETRATSSLSLSESPPERRSARALPASGSRRKSQRRPTRRAGRSPRRASSYTVERGMPSSSATSLVDRTSVRVSGRAAGVVIYIREARRRQSGPPGADFGGRLLGHDRRGAVAQAGFRRPRKSAPEPPGVRNHARVR
jgi:hypothetical protein